MNDGNLVLIKHKNNDNISNRIYRLKFCPVAMSTPVTVETTSFWAYAKFLFIHIFMSGSHWKFPYHKLKLKSCFKIEKQIMKIITYILAPELCACTSIKWSCVVKDSSLRGCDQGENDENLQRNKIKILAYWTIIQILKVGSSHTQKNN